LLITLIALVAFYRLCGLCRLYCGTTGLEGRTETPWHAFDLNAYTSRSRLLKTNSFPDPCFSQCFYHFLCIAFKFNDLVGLRAQALIMIVCQPGESLESTEGAHPDMVKLRHPASNQAAMFVFSPGDLTIQEVMTFDENKRSWFIDDNVRSDGKMHLSTPIDPIFLVLPYIRKVSLSLLSKSPLPSYFLIIFLLNFSVSANNAIRAVSARRRLS
jgi:hypothetical protein